ncbi:MAG: non-hydrolyzing UDP-N-acetylglucosamine 2-epimerase [Planctomycetota bacterium]|jgi:UDP-GlcNAc3NAcA epimerase
MKIAEIVGARPQFIKAAPVSRALRARSGVRDLLVHTGQHFDDNMSRVFFEQLDIPAPDHHLGIGPGTHGAQTGKMLEAVERVLLEEKPDRVLVYGDTNSTLAGALAAVKLHIPVAHVEAGLRSFNRNMPEEANRLLTDHMSAILFAPTDTAVENLRKEGIAGDRIVRTGDVMYDAALYYGGKSQKSRILDELGLEPKRFVLATIHRPENTDHPARLRGIFEGLARVSETLPVLLPLHPRTRKILKDGSLDAVASRIRIVDPVGYLEMVALERAARVLATDSGGMQKEAFFHRVPCVTLRDETEWVETVEAGANVLVGADADRLAGEVKRIIDGDVRVPDPGPLYGDGKSSAHIARVLCGERCASG